MHSMRVVLPAPLGPMRPTISPSYTSRSTSRTACSPPKRTPTPRIDSTGTSSPSGASSSTGPVATAWGPPAPTRAGRHRRAASSPPGPRASTARRGRSWAAVGGSASVGKALVEPATGVAGRPATAGPPAAGGVAGGAATGEAIAGRPDDEAGRPPLAAGPGPAAAPEDPPSSDAPPPGAAGGGAPAGVASGATSTADGGSKATDTVLPLLPLKSSPSL